MGHGDGNKTSKGNLNHGGIWRDETEWPLERTEYNTLFLTGEKELTPFLDSEHNSKLTYTFDPNNPVPTIGGQIVGMFEIIPEKEYPIFIMAVLNNIRKESIINTIIASLSDKNIEKNQVSSYSSENNKLISHLGELPFN